MKEYETKRWFVDKNNVNLRNHPHVIQASLWINEDEVVAIPTETVYGLAGNARSDAAIAKIFKAKGRPSDNPLIVHISSRSQLDGLVSAVSPAAERLMDQFWPGPLTIVLPKGSGVSQKVTAGLPTVAVRMPDHPVALALIEASGTPLAAPSANLSGKPSPTSASHVEKDLNGKIPGILDGGMTGVGLESTVVEVTEDAVMILRPGGITLEELQKFSAVPVFLDPGLQQNHSAPKSPGMKYTHYAPDAPFVLVDGSPAFLQQLVDNERELGRKIGILTTEENKERFKADHIIVCGSRSDLESVAKHLYEALRVFNDIGVDQIFGEVFPNEGVGAAIMNRLEKSAGGRVIKE